VLAGGRNISVAFFWMDFGHWNWRVMLVVEGSLPFLWLAVWLYLFKTIPRRRPGFRKANAFPVEPCAASLLSWRDRKKFLFSRAVTAQVFLLAAIYFCFVSGQMGLLFWLPSAMEIQDAKQSFDGNPVTQFLLLSAISVLVISRHRTKCMSAVFTLPELCCFGGTCILLAVATIPHSLLIAFAFIALSGVGAYGPMGASGLSDRNLVLKNCRLGNGLVNAIGNLGHTSLR